MFRSKYSAILTIILVILIIAIIVIVSILGIKAYKNSVSSKESKKAYAELTEGNIIETGNENENTVSNEVIENLVFEPIQNTTGSENTTTGGTGTTANRPKTKFYKDYPMVGYIKIQKTGVEYPILLDSSPGALEVAVGVMYPSNPKINEPGNTVIIGHNYRNGKFFSDNKKLEIGDTIQITDTTGKTLTYTIYEMFQTPETDTEYITRNRNGNTEISLSTCTDDGKDRLVILARVK